MAKYEEAERRAFAELAGDVGLSAARRELGYPSSWATGKKWTEEFGIEIELDELKAKASAYNNWYKDSELLIAQQDLIARARDLMDSKTLNPAELEKLGQTIKRATEMIRVIDGKANVYTAKEDTTELEALQMYDEFQRSRADDA
ncbi:MULTISPECIES: hypothetical protein [Rhodococcus]|uniref:hypothetical protein n=1 Tax=Rhodococcus TaxID=1827 RepID=UPI00038E4848|nr:MULTISPECIES: hypothetical protein [Rhodococcus]EQM33007.1 hypothetical protein N601_13550 [Rhodococcus erythropolis DN1]MDV8007377.1 hypothetical protein [Rhodococcus sp. IEGM 1318]